MRDKSKHGKIEKKTKLKSVCILIFIISIIILFIVKNNNIENNDIDKLVGNWTIDGITNYEFDNSGNGKLKLPKSTYNFKYTLKDNIIYLDFIDQKATDSNYEYSFENGKILLRGIKPSTGTYELTKQN